MIHMTVPGVEKVVVLKEPVSTKISPPTEEMPARGAITAGSPPLLELVLQGETSDHRQPVTEQKAILYHRSHTEGVRHLVGLGGEYHSLPVEHSLGREDHSTKSLHPLYIIHEKTPENVLRFVERVAEIAGNPQRGAYLGQTIISVVDGNVSGIVDHLTSTYKSLPLIFVRATLVGSDVLDLGLSHQIGHDTAMRNLASFFDLLGRYKPKGPDLRYEMLREVGWPCD